MIYDEPRGEKMAGKIKAKLQAIKAERIMKIHTKDVRNRIKNDNFSIICSNCIGGVIYHRLGKRFLSPTVNLWFDQNDFFKFVSDLKGYLQKDLEFENETPYPIAKLGDITIHFNHYHSEDEARACWIRRKERINFNNLYIIMYDRDGITESDIRKLENIPCRSKIVLSDKIHAEIPYVKTLVPSNNPNGCQFMDTDDYGLYTFEKQFDFVEWLNE